MKIAVLGTGMVGQALATRFAELGHQVMMGAREIGNAKALAWAEGQGARSADDFAAAAAFGEVVFIAVRGTASRDAAERAGPATLAGKIVVDVTNPLIFDAGSAYLDPEAVNTISSAVRLQQLIPEARLVKTLNTMTAPVMVEPGRAGTGHDVFVSGDDEEAKHAVIALLKQFGWDDPIDLGGLETARATEMLMPIWLRLWRKFGSADFNFAIVRRQA